MNTYIYLIRHGEVANPQNILYGRIPGYGLSKHGSEQALQTALFLQKQQIDIIYSSPLLRARQTAKIIQKKLNLPSIHISKLIIEMKTAYQGVPFDSLDPIQSEVYTKPLAPTDETVADQAKRMVQFVEKVTKKHNGKRIVLVSHGDPCMSLIAALQGIPLTFKAVRPKHYIKHAEVFKITLDETKNSTIVSIFKPI